MASGDRHYAHTRHELSTLGHGKPAGILIGFESEDDWFEYRLEHDARFLSRIEKARKSLREDKGVKLETLDRAG